MPTVTISLTDAAYDIYRELDKGTRSRQLSTALIQWKQQVDEYARRRAEEKTEEEVKNNGK